MFLKTLVVSGFPGVGKTVFFEQAKKSKFRVLDSDSSQFSWISEGVRNPDFLNCYIRHIENNLYKADVILVSSHDIVRQALAKNNIEYILVYPDRSLKWEYIERYASRGNNEGFLKLLEEKWDDFIDQIEQETYPTKIKLGEGQYLSDVLDAILLNLKR